MSDFEFGIGLSYKHWDQLRPLGIKKDTNGEIEKRVDMMRQFSAPGVGLFLEETGEEVPDFAEVIFALGLTIAYYDVFLGFEMTEAEVTISVFSSLLRTRMSRADAEAVEAGVIAKLMKAAETRRSEDDSD